MRVWKDHTAFQKHVQLLFVHEKRCSNAHNGHAYSSKASPGTLWLQLLVLSSWLMLCLPRCMDLACSTAPASTFPLWCINIINFVCAQSHRSQQLWWTLFAGSKNLCHGGFVFPAALCKPPITSGAVFFHLSAPTLFLHFYLATLPWQLWPSALHSGFQINILLHPMVILLWSLQSREGELSCLLYQQLLKHGWHHRSLTDVQWTSDLLCKLQSYYC